MAAYELAQGNLEVSTTLMLAFHCLLRTGKALNLSSDSVLLGSSAGILNLADTKTSRKHGAHDAISIIELPKDQGLQSLKLWNASPQCFRTRFNKLMALYGLQHHGFRPYSLRRGGATALFQETNSMETVLTRGRWHHFLLPG